MFAHYSVQKASALSHEASVLKYGTLGTTTDIAGNNDRYRKTKSGAACTLCKLRAVNFDTTSRPA
jgi:hypothetical protein